MNPDLAKAHERILNGPDCAAKDFLLKHLHDQQEAEKPKPIEPKEIVTYRCSKGHEFSKPRQDSPVGNCPQCTFINIDFRKVSDKPGWMTGPKLKTTGNPIRADFENDPELQEKP